MSSALLTCSRHVSVHAPRLPVCCVHLPFQQTRSKTKLPDNGGEILVRLRHDVLSWGAAGDLVKVRRGRMRRQWFPMRLADYVPFPESRDLKRAGVKGDRRFDHPHGYDVRGGVRGRNVEIKSPGGPRAEEKSKVVELPVTPAAAPAVEVEKVDPSRARELVSQLLPPEFIFHRNAVPENAGEPDAPEDASSAASPAEEEETQQSQGGRRIYGSVSRADIASQIRAALNENEEASRVLVSEEDVRIMHPTEFGELPLIKELGEYGIQVRIKGTKESIRRTIKVSEQQP